MTLHSVVRRFNRSVVWLACAALGAVGHAADRKPNIVLFMADDFGYEGVRANGGEYHTPHLDRLTATGMRFEQCHVQPLCTPTRFQLMTGIYNVRNYIEFGLIDPNATTFGHLMKRTGDPRLVDDGKFFETPPMSGPTNEGPTKQEKAKKKKQ